MTSIITRSAAALAAAALITVGLAGCFPLPPSTPTPSNSTPSTSEPVDPSTDPTEGTDPTESPDASAPSGDQYEYTADTGTGVVWNFEPTSSEVIPVDATGKAADPGMQLVLIHIDADLIEGDGNFYYDFTIKIVNDENGDLYGLSSGTSFLADNDLFFAGSGASFVDGQGIYQIPATMSPTHLRFIVNETQETWDFEVQP